ncbi:hypothetical protein LINGRAHAP2_LOCUS18012, partial [Linum grandiflorum]
STVATRSGREESREVVAAVGARRKERKPPPLELGREEGAVAASAGCKERGKEADIADMKEKKPGATEAESKEGGGTQRSSAASFEVQDGEMKLPESREFDLRHRVRESKSLVVRDRDSKTFGVVGGSPESCRQRGSSPEKKVDQSVVLES